MGKFNKNHLWWIIPLGIIIIVSSIFLIIGRQQQKQEGEDIEIWRKAETIKCINGAIDTHIDVGAKGYELTRNVFYIVEINKFIFEAETHYSPIVRITQIGECVGDESVIAGKENFEQVITNEKKTFTVIELLANLRSGNTKIESLHKK